MGQQFVRGTLRGNAIALCGSGICSFWPANSGRAGIALVLVRFRLGIFGIGFRGHTFHFETGGCHLGEVGHVGRLVDYCSGDPFGNTASAYPEPWLYVCGRFCPDWAAFVQPPAVPSLPGGKRNE